MEIKRFFFFFYSEHSCEALTFKTVAREGDLTKNEIPLPLEQKNYEMALLNVLVKLAFQRQ